MCEWLSNAEWCDVQLLCKGRVFSAHRAVLASVSPFMRRLLLSCPEENSPTIIFLPDFELKTMFSVLYYIYNGEVAVPKCGLESFLDIIITLEIYIDSYFLDKIKANIHGYDKKIEKNISYSKGALKIINSSKSVFELASNELYHDKKYVTIRKGQFEIRQGSVGYADHADSALNCNETQQQRPYLEYKHSQHGDRQKKSFLRDSFIETYPRNGNVNGLGAGVPAIPNEVYLDTTSALLTNANVEDPRLTAASITNNPKHIKNVSFNTHVDSELNTSFNEVKSKLLKNPKSEKRADFFSAVPIVEKEPTVAERYMSGYLDLTKGQSINNYIFTVPYRNQGIPCNNTETHLQISKSLTQNKCNKTNILPKTAISNEVLQSPWCPRLPISYKPLRRKPQTKDTSSLITTNDTAVMINDKNNNIESSIVDTVKTEENKIIVQPNEAICKVITDVVSDISLKCNATNKILADHVSLASNKSHSSSARFTCSECGKTFSQLRNYKYHMSVHRGTKEFAASCTVCGKYFNDKGYLSSHMKIHRNRKEYKCQLCPKSFNQRVAYNMHVRIHTGVKPHVCDECGKAFSRKMLLKQHQRTHSGERPYACPHCDKRFADRSNMTLHLRLHTGVKPFTCSLCPKSFTKKHHLKSHLNYHTGAKPYSCPRCRLAFTQSSNMRTHLKKCNANETQHNSELNLA